MASEIVIQIGPEVVRKPCWLCSPSKDAVHICWCHALGIREDTPMVISMNKVKPCVCPDGPREGIDDAARKDAGNP